MVSSGRDNQYVVMAATTGSRRTPRPGPHTQIAGSTHEPGLVGSPPATRIRSSGWRDPRLVVGVAIVAVCVLLGGTLLDRADDTVGVWALRSAMTRGQPIDQADLVRTEVRFASVSAADRYVSAGDRVPMGAKLTRDVGAGEFLPREALSTADTRPVTAVPVSVDSEAVPATVVPGSVVDVWVVPDPGVASSRAHQHADAVLVFHRVAVVSAATSSTSLGPSATRQVIVGLAADQTADLATALSALEAGTVVVTAQQ
jgi:hypothetical protein